MRLNFELFISYSQIAVFWPDLESPFNPWTDEHVEQGFSLRPGSVSFKTSMESGTCSLEIFDTDSNEFSSSECIRPIEVPFEVPDSNEVEIASISDSRVISITAGSVQLRFEEFGDNIVRLSFLRK